MIDGVDFFELDAEKYWAFPSNYKKDKKAETKNFIFSGDYIGALKKDGHYYRFIKEDDKWSFQGRSRSTTGEYTNKIEWVPHLHNFFRMLPNGTVLLGEGYDPKNPGSKNATRIMGCLKEKSIQRQKETPLHFYIFDVWAYNGKSLLNTPIEKRLEILKKQIGHWASCNGSPYVEIAKYYTGKNLYEVLNLALETGEEGIVMTRLGTCPEPGKRTSRKTLKVKKELQNNIDCFFTGAYKEPTIEYTGLEVDAWEYWVDVRTGEKLFGDYFVECTKKKRLLMPVTKNYFLGYAGSAQLGAYDPEKDSIVVIGYVSGITDEIKKGLAQNNEEYVKRPCEVTAMEIDDEHGGLRHPKFLGFREDIDWKDCTVDKIYGKEGNLK